ncbi:MAG: AIR synthase family protein [Nitrososphaeria archaeon]
MSTQDLVQPAGVGVDFGVVKVSNKYLIVSADPITGVREDIGWYAVNVSANDVATSGTRPTFLINVILLSEKESNTSLSKITKDVDKACKSLNISVVGGHTEITKGLDQTILVVTSFAFTDKYVSSKNAQEGDVILMTKTVGLEGTSILVRDYGKYLKKLSTSEKRNALNMVERISVVNEAVLAFNTGYVHAMHDPTEGGIIGGLYEMSVASNLGFMVYESKIPIAQETIKVCKSLKVDPLKLISSGVLLMAVDPAGKDVVKEVLNKNNIVVSEIGFFKAGDRVLISKEKKTLVNSSPVDELWKLKRQRL